ncbi:oligosaccharide flippase family protein [Candidatus Woesearchaeota archaeon]|nr:oligosaccharide flippase family protein [Candidatus Woesearchaeota archaeon]
MDYLAWIRSRLERHEHYRESFWLMSNSVLTAGLGFIFWTLAARSLSADDVGHATIIISAMELIAIASFLGLNVAMIYFLPRVKLKSRIIGTTLSMTAIMSFVIATIFTVYMLLSGQAFLFHTILTQSMFVVLSVVYSLFLLIDSIFIARNESSRLALKNLVFSVLKICLLFLLISWSGFGIYLAWTISAAFALLIGLAMLPRFRLTLHIDVLTHIMPYGFANYLAQFFEMLPRLLLPFIIAVILDAEQSAYYYITWMIAGLLGFATNAITIPMLSQARVSTMKRSLGRAVLVLYPLLISGVVFLYFFGELLLHIFGKNYADDAATLLFLFALAMLPESVNAIYMTMCNIKKKVVQVAITQFAISSIILILCVLWLPYGLIYVGYAWLLGHGLVAVVTLYRTIIMVRS